MYYLAFILLSTTITLLIVGGVSVSATSEDESTLPNNINNNNNKDEGFANLVAWMKLHGGRVDPRIDVTTSTNTNGIRGVVALSAIEEGTELLFCPWKLVIGSSGMQEGQLMQTAGEYGMCTVVEQMAEQIRLKSQSPWQPYLDHIELPRLSATWEASTLAELQGLPPNRDAGRHLRWFSQKCGGDLDDAPTMRSLVSFVSRASEVGMVPIYDLLNHHNGKRNAKLVLTDAGVTLVTVGGNNDDNDHGHDGNGIIERGQEIFLSYGIKTSSTMYRDYGFVEEWPACWNFRDSASGDNFAFVLFPHGVVAISPSAEYLKSIWSSNSSTAEYESSARRHTESLSENDLNRFGRAVYDHLGEFPTTLVEDKMELENNQRLLLAKKDLASIGGPHSNIEDVLNAINYRIAFKSAMAASSTYASSMMDRKMRGRQEL